MRDYGACSVSCGRGVETKRVRCFNKATGGFANDRACIGAGHPKPVEERECVRAPCGTVAVLRTEGVMQPVRACCLFLSLTTLSCIENLDFLI